MKKYIQETIIESIETKKSLLSDNKLISEIEIATTWVIDCYNNGGKTLFAGNGGSAADAQHLAGEFVSRFYYDRPGLASIALTTDTSILTAIGNDYGYEKLFSRQVEANGKEGDVFFGISTSGNSPNVINALVKCKEMGIKTISLTGASGGKMLDISDLCIRVPSGETPRIQEMHELIGHIICALTERKIFPQKEG